MLVNQKIAKYNPKRLKLYNFKKGMVPSQSSSPGNLGEPQIYIGWTGGNPPSTKQPVPWGKAEPSVAIYMQNKRARRVLLIAYLTNN